jgi:hypothetical protein
LLRCNFLEPVLTSLLGLEPLPFRVMQRVCLLGFLAFLASRLECGFEITVVVLSSAFKRGSVAGLLQLVGYALGLFR